MDFEQSFFVAMLAVGGLVVGRIFTEWMKGKSAKPSGGPVAPSAPGVVDVISADFDKATDAMMRLLRTVEREDFGIPFGDIFEAMAKRDWSNLFSYANKLVDDLKSDKQVFATFGPGFYSQFEKRLKDKDEFRRMAQMIDDRRQAIAQEANNTMRDGVLAPQEKPATKKTKA